MTQDSTFVYASYAAVFLLKLVSPTFASFIDEAVAMRLVTQLADVLEEAAVDEQHTPALCESPSARSAINDWSDPLPSHHQTRHSCAC